jgi:hypothetical protein
MIRMRKAGLTPGYCSGQLSSQLPWAGASSAAAAPAQAPTRRPADVNRTGTFTVDNVDGGPGAPSAASGSVETDLDIEQSGALAPGANVIDYQAPNTDPGFVDAFFTAASQNIASGVSASWGESG